MRYSTDPPTRSASQRGGNGNWSGPAELARRYGLPADGSYADACHLCYKTRRALRATFPEILGPDQAYGILE